MKKRIAMPLLLSIVLSFSVSTTSYSLTKEEVFQKVAESDGKYVPGSPLTNDDFYIISDEDLYDKYDNHMLTYFYGEYGKGSGCFQTMSAGTKEEVEKVGEEFCHMFTYRGLNVDYASEDEIIKKYGLGVTRRFDSSTDLIYNVLKSNGGPIADGMFEKCYKCIIYNYNDLAQIVFFLNENDEIVYTAYVEGIWYKADSALTKTVQEYLNLAGYECGTADGIAGEKTKSAISKYQEDHGLYVSGNIDDELMKCIEAEKSSTGEVIPEDTNAGATESESTDTAGQETEESQVETDQQRSPYREDVPYEDLMRNPYDHSSELYTFSGTVLQTFDSYKIRLALNGNSDEQVVCTYGWLQMPVDLLEGDTVTVFGEFEGKEKYTNVLNVDTEFPQFLCYKMETPGGTAKPWTNSTIEAVRQAEEDALSG